jgi:FkbM family methyltransferase
MSSVEWDNFTYFTNDNEFLNNIKIGQAEPYGSGKQLDAIKKYTAMYPNRTRNMIDVGAHIGTTMLPYSRIFKNIYGFEPNTESYNFCIKNIAHNNIVNCIVENCAIHDKHIVGRTLYHNTCNTGCIYFKEDETGDINTKILDEDSRLIDIDFIKIDTEGAEFLVIKSAINIIKTYKPFIQAEMNGLAEKNFNLSTKDLIQLLSNLGYQNIPNTDFFMHNEYPVIL